MAERPAGLSWYCPTCQVVVEANVEAQDTPTEYVDRVTCPTCQGLLGVVSTPIPPPEPEPTSWTGPPIR